MATIKLKSIPQSKLERYFQLKAQVKELESLRLELIEMANANLPCQPGRFVLSISKKAGQVRPAWKEEGEKLAKQHGVEGWVEAVISRTQPGNPGYEVNVVDREQPLNEKS